MQVFNSDKEFVQDLAKQIHRAGGAVYYVGGYVRDQILGRPNKDIDIEVHNIKQEKLKIILQKYGKVNEQGKSFGVLKVGKYDIDIAQPRREEKTGDKHTDFKVVVDPFMGTQEAAKRRDFTMNALMMDVLTEQIIDHFDGLKDIQNKQIRHVNNITFAEDPLRVLRGAQFAARFGFDVAPSTKKIMSTLDLSALSRERINEELKKAFLKSEKPSIFFDILKEVRQLDVWFPEIKALIDSPQNPVYHPEGDVYTHTMMVVDNLTQMRSQTETPYALLLGGLCHDFGKPLTCQFNEQKQIYQNIGHADAGVEPAKQFLNRVVHDNSIKQYVMEMVEYHDEPYSMYMSNSRLTKTNKFFDKLHYPEDLILITCADRTTDSIEDVSKYKEWLTDRLDKYQTLMKQPQVMGRDLVSLGFKPSPEFSEILQDAHARHIRGETKEQVIKAICKQYDIDLTQINKINKDFDDEINDIVNVKSVINTDISPNNTEDIDTTLDELKDIDTQNTEEETLS